MGKENETKWRPGDAVAEMIERLQSEEKKAKHQLMILRKAVDSNPEDHLEAWSLIIGDIPFDERGKGANISYAEKAVFSALTLYAWHQWGQTEPMHQNGVYPGAAAFKCVQAETDPGDMERKKERILRILKKLSGQETHESRVRQLKWLVQMLRADGIPLDYGRLANDLYYMHFPLSRKKIALGYARDLG